MKTQAIRELSLCASAARILLASDPLPFEIGARKYVRHSGLRGHSRDTRAANFRVLKPLLNLEYGFVAMMQLGREVRVENAAGDPRHPQERTGPFQA